MEAFDIPSPGNKVVDTFRASDSSGTSPSWRIYSRPRGVTFLAAYLAGGGGGGAGALGAAASTGAGGGGSSSFTRALFLWDALPDRLYLLIGRGGLAVSANTAGNAGQLSFIAIQPSTSAQGLITGSGNAAAGGGAIAATGGTAGTAATVANNPLLNLSISFNSVIGNAGTAGGVNTGAAGGAFNITLANGPFLPGTGGGGVTTTDFAGGGYNAASPWLAHAGGVAAGGRGQDGYVPRLVGMGIQNGIISPAYYGGTGGGTSDLGTGGAGGDGALGSGGGGGGGGTTGGGGGRGGDGFIVLASW